MPSLRVDHGGVRDQGDQLHHAAEDLAGVKKALGGDHGGGILDVTGMVEGAVASMQFGEYAGAAFHAFAKAWNAECAALEGALRELHGALSVSSRDYRHTDVKIKGDLETVAYTRQGQS
ncbi:hypothetical protein ACIHFE_29830 [Streptomyces sp. NPDC052396]|uniref:hypothetical protein n=1 Tax=Streptomyces sp. NPDC052396 TaxID=3365689 RepID=UPI0037D1B312